MKTGKNAGILTVGVLWGYRSEEELKENGANRLIRKPWEIPALLEEEA
jgi:phosphoglycolate phosphatase